MSLQRTWEWGRGLVLSTLQAFVFLLPLSAPFGPLLFLVFALLIGAIFSCWLYSCLLWNRRETVEASALPGLSMGPFPVPTLSLQSLQPSAGHSVSLVIFFDRFSPKSKIPAR